jgi:hypothetical protein
MTRDELIEAGYAVLDDALNRGDPGPLMGLVIDALEPLIRADERAREAARLSPVRPDLRAKVEALPMWSRLAQDDVILRADVLALLDDGGHR